MKDDGTQREFDTGATRSSAADRIDPEGFLSPLSIERYCQYLLKHQTQANGEVRESDNWQKGMPLTSYMKGLWRHFLHLWTRHRGYEPMDDKAAVDMQEDLCAIIFNAQGYLHELLREEREEILKQEYPLIACDPCGPDFVLVVERVDPYDAPPETRVKPKVECSCCELEDFTVETCPLCTECTGGRNTPKAN